MRADYVQTFTSPKNGKVYAYYRRWGKRIRIKSEVGTPAFFAEIKEIEKAGGALTLPAAGTLGRVIADYKASENFIGLKPATKLSYNRAFDVLKDFGDLPIASFTRPKILQIRDKVIQPKRGRWMANYCVTALGVVLGFAHDAGTIDSHPLERRVRKIRKPKGTADINRPWSAAERAVVLAEAPVHIRLPIALAMCTGLRKADVFTMTAECIKDGMVFVRTSKTDQPIGLPIHPVLAEALAERPVIGVGKLCQTAGGRPMTATGFDTYWQRMKDRLETAGKVKPGLTFHGLRHTLGTLLSEAGLPDSKIADVLGQKSPSMARHYSKNSKLDTATAEVVKGINFKG